MMNSEMEEFMENLHKPQMEETPYEKAFKLALLNSRKSSVIGILLIGFPAIVLFVAIGQAIFNFNILDKAFNNITSHLSLTLRAIIFFILTVGFPIIAVALNMLSITFFNYNRQQKEFNLTFKIRWWNILITLAGGILAAFFLLHLIADSLAGK
ncbi:MAG: hypothetical protein EPN39_14880 [Chitinophagaceae bacterium]|nr:MAG: hypothetical protein EPN39_14880 [Chitinophagaceae bacterium]